MGLSVCKQCCCCCPCCHHTVDIPVIGENNNTSPNVKNPDKPEMADRIKTYRMHELNPDFRFQLEDYINGKVKKGSTDISSPSTGTSPNRSSQEVNIVGSEVPINTIDEGKGRQARLEALSRKSKTKVSTYSYKARTAEDLEVRKGEELEVVQEEGPWILVRKLKDNEESITGYIPRTFLANAGSLEAEDWYFNSLTKMDAKRYLLQEQNGNGSFLVWKKDEECYYLSVRKDSMVRNYRIHELDGSFYLVRRASYPTIKELVQHYLETQDSLCVKLEKPCVKLDLPPMDSISHSTVNQLEIDPNSIRKVKKLGKGVFGQVWLGLWNGTTEVAIKELQVSAESLQKSLREEAETMWKLSHERLLKLYAVCLQTQPVFIVTEYMENGTLKRYLRDHQVRRDLEYHQLVDFAVQISQGMVYMEQKGCVHRDLRSENILLSAMMSCKIGDFGLARFMDSSSIAVSAGAQIPIKWTAPEVFNQQKYSCKSDVWSFGVLLGEIMTYGKLPFEGKSNGDYRQDILQGTPLKPPSETPNAVSNIMEMCWRHQPSARPTFSEIERFLMDLLNPVLVDETVE